MQFKPIGNIQTPYKTEEDCPIQPIYSSSAEGKIEIFEQMEYMHQGTHADQIL